jgi:Mn-dependent DtxR family transcriptional regulator
LGEGATGGFTIRDLNGKTLEAIIGEGCTSLESGDYSTAMGLRPKVAKVMLKRLLDMGLLERPYRGCYRLTDEGKKILKEAEGP